jgi:hypothetical protein
MKQAASFIVTAMRNSDPTQKINIIIGSHIPVWALAYLGFRYKYISG